VARNRERMWRKVLTFDCIFDDHSQFSHESCTQHQITGHEVSEEVAALVTMMVAWVHRNAATVAPSRNLRRVRSYTKQLRSKGRNLGEKKSEDDGSERLHGVQ